MGSIKTAMQLGFRKAGLVISVDSGEPAGKGWSVYWPSRDEKIRKAADMERKAKLKAADLEKVLNELQSVAVTVAVNEGDDWRYSAKFKEAYNMLEEEARYICRHPKGSALRAEAAAITHPDVVWLLGFCTVAHVLEDAGLL